MTKQLELPSLGKLPSISQLMAEGRKYGACVVAGVQSTSQLYHHYGDAESSTLIGLFKTKFAFSSDDPRMGELYSKLCGRKNTISQHTNNPIANFLSVILNIEIFDKLNYIF